MKIQFVIALVLMCIATQAQTIFITKGKVEYEKKVNQYKTFASDEDEDNMWMEEMKKTIPKFVSDIYELQFTPTQTLYKLKAENENNKYMWGIKPSENDFCFTNIINDKQTIYKDVFEQSYLIEDSIKKFEWKITGETRDIAGFECKKAITKICDSVYVVAFYTEQIMISSGPESFGGLPGLILGLAVPRLYTTWFATKVETNLTIDPQLIAKSKAKKATYSSFNAELIKALKDWGKYGFKRIWSYNL